MGCHTWYYKKGGNIEKFTVEEIKKELKADCEYKYIKEFDKESIEDFLDKKFNKICIYNRFNGDYYINIDYPNLFRVGGYPDIVLRSYEETIKYINVYKAEITNENKQKLKEFWKKYPDGIIEFG